MNKADRRRAEIIHREAGKPGFKGRINAKCVECIYDPYAEGNWRKQVQKCTDKRCPLYEVRPVSSVGEED